MSPISDRRAALFHWPHHGYGSTQVLCMQKCLTINESIIQLSETIKHLRRSKLWFHKHLTIPKQSIRNRGAHRKPSLYEDGGESMIDLWVNNELGLSWCVPSSSHLIQKAIFFFSLLSSHATKGADQKKKKKKTIRFSMFCVHVIVHTCLSPSSHVWMDRNCLSDSTKPLKLQKHPLISIQLTILSFCF